MFGLFKSKRKNCYYTTQLVYDFKFNANEYDNIRKILDNSNYYKYIPYLN